MKPWNYVLAAGVLLVCAYEVRAHVGNDYPTITALLRQVTSEHIIIAVAIGTLIGHLYWPR